MIWPCQSQSEKLDALNVADVGLSVTLSKITNKSSKMKKYNHCL